MKTRNLTLAILVCFCLPLAGVLYATPAALAAGLEAPVTGKVDVVSAGEATVEGGVLNPNAPGELGEYQYLYKSSGSECEGESATAPEPGLGLEKEAVSPVKLTGLLASDTYTVCLFVRDQAGETALGGPVTFSTPPAPPVITGESSTYVGSTEAAVIAQIDPEGLGASYKVEYGASEAYGQSTEEVSLPAGWASVGVEVSLSGLTPDTQYYYRFVATSAVHETARASENQSFTTLPTGPSHGSEGCPNESLRVGRSASLPDCRAYELVTPTELGRSLDMTFSQGNDRAIPSSDGEHLALETVAAIEPNRETQASVNGTDAVFSRTPEGWKMKSLIVPGGNANVIAIQKDGLFSPDLSQVAFGSTTHLNLVEYSLGEALEFGPVGGPYQTVASVPRGSGEFMGANAGTTGAGGVPPFSDIVFQTTDHEILPPGPERSAAEEANEGSKELYELSEGRLHLVNIIDSGSQIKLVDRCGAGLGRGESYQVPAAAGDAISADGSKVFFMTKYSEEGNCLEPSRLFMRVDNRETVEIPNPEPSMDATYAGATQDGSHVFFKTGPNLVTPTTLYVYDTLTGVVSKIANNVQPLSGSPSPAVVVSEDGSTVYYRTLPLLSVPGHEVYEIFHYDVQTGVSTFVAEAIDSKFEDEPYYTTPNGQFLVFPSLGVTHEPRGTSNNSNENAKQELYRYDATDGSVTCVSCGGGNAPAEGEVEGPEAGSFGGSILPTEDNTPGFTPVSENGEEVFFQTSSRLAPQDTNSTFTNITDPNDPAPGRDVYEWVADGGEEAPGVHCALSVGCTHLISSGEDVGPGVLLGASRDGKNVFFATAAVLAAGATPEFTNIYDARVDGGFPSAVPVSECSACEGVGSPPPLFNTPASETFVGAGNPVSVPVVKTKAKPGKAKSQQKHKLKRKGKPKKGRARKDKKSSVAERRGGFVRASGRGK
jgi:hypothetical protein